MQVISCLVNIKNIIFQLMNNQYRLQNYTYNFFKLKCLLLIQKLFSQKFILIARWFLLQVFTLKQSDSKIVISNLEDHCILIFSNMEAFFELLTGIFNFEKSDSNIVISDLENPCIIHWEKDLFTVNISFSQCTYFQQNLYLDFWPSFRKSAIISNFQSLI